MKNIKGVNKEQNKIRHAEHNIKVNRELPWGVLFDLDGVLVDSESLYTQIWNRINKEYPTEQPNFAEEIKGTTLENILATHYPDPVLRKKVETRLLEEESKMVYRYCNGAYELLKNLKDHGIPMALYTSSNDIKMAHLYKDIPGINDFFDTIVTGDQVKKSKPDPEGYLEAAKRLDLKRGRWVVIEDSLQGVKAGKASGGVVLGISGTLPENILAPYCNEVTNSLEGVTIESLYKLIS